MYVIEISIKTFKRTPYIYPVLKLPKIFFKTAILWNYELHIVENSTIPFKRAEIVKPNSNIYQSELFSIQKKN